MSKLNRYEPYDGGMSNFETVKLEQEVLALKEEIKIKEKLIYEIQLKCDHHYQFVTSGAYDDYYICNICGHEIER